MLRDFMNQVLLNIGNYNLTVAGVLGSVFATIVIFSLLRLAIIWLNRYSSDHSMPEPTVNFLRRWLYIAALLILAILCLLSLDLNQAIWVGSDSSSITVRGVLVALLLVVGARIADKIISSRILEELETHTAQDIYKDQYGQKNESSITRTVQYALFLIVAVFILRNSAFDYSLHSFNVGSEEINITISKVILALIILLISRLIIWSVVNIFLYGWYRREKIDMGKQYAYNQLISYVFYFIAVIFALQYIGIDLTIFLAGAAAILVGVGIALQQVISDFFSGLVILFERSVEVGDFLDLGNFKGTVKKIGLRASVLETLERKDVVIPNSQLVNERVTNWSSTRQTTRFDVSVGVAYGSDTQKVKEILLHCVNETKGILKNPAPFVRFENFGNNSLDFTVFFFSNNLMIIEDIKSNLRFEIDQNFREHNISIPFPQRDIWVRSLPKQ